MTNQKDNINSAFAISCSAAAWGGYGVGLGFQCWGAKEEGGTYYRVAPRNLLIGRTILAVPNSCQCQ